MPRTRPLRTKEEIAAIPPEKSVTIELEPEGQVTLQEENPFEEPTETKPQQTRQTKKPDPEPDDTADLKQQLEDMRKAKDESDRRIQAEIQARQEAERLVRERDQEVSTSRIRAEDAEYDAILNAIGAAEAEAEKAQSDLAVAGEAADHKAAAEANRRLARAESRLAQLNDGKDAIERAKTAEAARLKQERENPKPTQTQKQPTVEEYIDQLPNLMQSQKQWLRDHPETLTNNRMNLRLQGAHVEAEDQGLRPGSKPYFDYIEERLGFKTADPEEEETVPTSVSAPPSRNSTNPSTGKPTGNRITLTPEQREMARLSGIDELTYAKQLQRLNQLKADGVIN